YVEHLEKHYAHSTARALDRGEIQSMLGTSRYFGGYLDSTGAHLHPLRYAIGLARACSSAGVRIFERSHVVDLADGVVRTPEAEVIADSILLACNGYLDGLSMPPQRRTLPLNNFILATEPLGKERASRINRDKVCASDTRFVLNYFRLSPDGRMLWGGGESTGRTFPADLAGFVRARMLEIYPDLSDVAITHAWGGTLGITASRMPVFQQVTPRVRSIGGWSGSGIHMATMGGRIAAEAIAGEAGDWDLLAKMPTPRFPGGDWFRMPLLRMAMFWYGLRDRL
ncbi:MAG: FAD-binding oxidoreductase, partial [Pseudomonadota bacterium]